MIHTDFNTYRDEKIVELLNSSTSENDYNSLFSVISIRYSKKMMVFIKQKIYNVWGLSCSTEDIEDILQNSFIKLQNNFSNYNSSKGSFNNYFYLIVRSCTFDYIKKNNKFFFDTDSLDNLLDDNSLNNCDDTIIQSHSYLPDYCKHLSSEDIFNLVLSLYSEKNRLSANLHIEPRILYFSHNFFLHDRGKVFIEIYGKIKLTQILANLIIEFCDFYKIQPTIIDYRDFVDSLVKKSIGESNFNTFLEGDNSSKCLIQWQEYVHRMFFKKIQKSLSTGGAIYEY